MIKYNLTEVLNLVAMITKSMGGNRRGDDYDDLLLLVENITNDYNSLLEKYIIETEGVTGLHERET